jgi:hypothetical protein
MSKVPTDVIGNIPAYIDAVMKYDESVIRQHLEWCYKELKGCNEERS